MTDEQANPIPAKGIGGRVNIGVTPTTTTITTTTTVPPRVTTTTTTAPPTPPPAPELTPTATIPPISFPGVPGPGKTADSPDVIQILSTPTAGSIGLSVDLKAGKQEVEIFFSVEIPTLGKFFIFFKDGRLTADTKETALGRGVITADIKVSLFGFLSTLGIPEIPVKGLLKSEYKIGLELRDAATGAMVSTSTVVFRVVAEVIPF